jgi:hypothetical protein
MKALKMTLLRRKAVTPRFYSVSGPGSRIKDAVS